MSRDNTLLAKLAFADPDKQSPVHDAACRYLAQKDVALKLCQASTKLTDLGYCVNSGQWGSGSDWHLPDVFEMEKTAIEEPVSKGSGQYKTTIGFMDVVIYSKQQALDAESRKMMPAFGIGVEVKHTQKNIHDAVRQIKLYQEYTDNPFGLIKAAGKAFPQQWGTKIVDWFLATTFAISQQELELLISSDIRYIKLGEGFDEYLKRASTPSAPKSDLEF